MDVIELLVLERYIFLDLNGDLHHYIVRSEIIKIELEARGLTGSTLWITTTDGARVRYWPNNQTPADIAELLQTYI